MKKPGRNDPCACGSGRKYKHCCASLDDNQAAGTRALNASIPKAIQAALEHHQAGRLPQAEAIYRQVLQVAPKHPDALHLLGVIAHQAGNSATAVDFISKAIQANPTASMYCNLGAALRNQRKLDAAIASYRKALAIKPDYAEAHFNLGIALQEKDEFDAAIASYRKALAIKPDYAEAHYNLGNTVKDQGKISAALESYRRTLAIRPDYAEAHSNYLLTAQCNPDYSPAELRAEHVAYAKRFEAPLRAAWSPHHNDRNPQRRLRIGFVSGDLRISPVGFFLESVLAQLDPQALEVVLYPTYSQIDALTERLQALGFAWQSLVGVADERAAQRIREDAIDILIDLSGHTDHNRMRLFARKPAPVQVAWIGYPATTGLQAIDYILCDRHVVPPGEFDQFVEQPWHLPDTYLCMTPLRDEIAVGALPALTRGHITFGSFNHFTKMNDAVVALWARLLQAVPGSRLFLKTRQLDDAALQRATLARFAACGIAAERIALKGATPRAAHLAAFHSVDIALDPFPYNGTTTSVEGLWMGVPLIARRGDRFVAHQGESILHNVGLSDWIAADDEDYVAIAVARAADLASLAALRAGLRARLLASVLCDAARFARNFEAALRGMWQAYCSDGRSPVAPSADASHAETHYKTGMALQQQGKLDAAIESYRRAVSINPRFAGAYCNLGIALQQQGKLDAAIESYRKALAINPDFAEAYSNLGNALKDQGKLDAAVESYRRAIAIRPEFAGAHSNLGIALQQQGMLEAALASFDRALAIKPDFAEAHYNRGIALQEQVRLDAAAESYLRAVAIRPDYVEAHNNLGSVLQEQGRLDAAIASFRRALAIKPDYATAHSNYLMTAQYSPAYSPADLFAGHVAFAERFEAPLRPGWPSHHSDRDPRRRLKIGFVSADLRAHPVGFLLEILLAHVDRQALDIVLYPNHTHVDALTRRLQAMGFAWKSLVGVSDEHGAQRIRGDAVDILIDLSGHTDRNRLGLFARKPAPIQVTYFGYLATTGLQAIDYVLCDRYAVPPGEAGQFVEKPWYLPDTFLCFTPPREQIAVGALPALNRRQVTFGCFNNLTKVNDAVVALWAQLLLAVPGSRLLLKYKQLDDPAVRQATGSRFAACGISPERLVLAGGSSRAEHLASHNGVDIALDPFPYNGTTTSVEALWMGVPLITRRGDRFVAHQGESILHNVGLPGWIADDDEAYVAIAAARAADLAGLSALRAALRARLLASPLCDTARFARNFEAALREMWQAYCSR